MEEKIALRQQKKPLNRANSMNLNITIPSQQIRYVFVQIFWILQLHTTIFRPNSVNALEDLVQCPICLDKLKEPRMLPCQHTFCLSCLQSHLLAKHLVHNANSNSDKLLQCPVCQQRIKLENGLESLKALPSNRYIDSLLLVIERNSPSSPSKGLPDSRCVKCQILCDQHRQICQHCLQVGYMCD